MSSQRLWRHIQGLHRTQWNENPVLRGEMDRSSILNPEAISNWQLLTNEQLVFSNGASLGIQTTLNGRSYTWLNIWKGFGCLFVCLILLFEKFLPHWYFAYILWFLILCFYGACVCFSLMLFLSYVFLFYYLLVFLRERERRSGVGKVGSGEDLGEDEGEGVARI